MRLAVVIMLSLLPVSPAAPDAIAFSDYKLLEEGMTEGEILQRVGPPDRESLVHTHDLYRKIWYYIPDGSYSGDWLTEIHFGPAGKVIQIERIPPYGKGGF